MRVTIGKNWVELREAEDLLEEDREAVIRTMAGAGDDINLRTYIGRRQWVTNLVTNWSFQQPLPKDEPKALSKIPIKAYNAILEQVDKILEKLNEEEEEAKDPPVPSAD